MRCRGERVRRARVRRAMCMKERAYARVRRVRVSVCMGRGRRGVRECVARGEGNTDVGVGGCMTSRATSWRVWGVVWRRCVAVDVDR